ncbi:MAG: hypothetical protein SGJ18_03930 [Pseudomonadota bacterium]|nr:hypothetical protein [Pseudomonadota bacterium]
MKKIVKIIIGSLALLTTQKSLALELETLVFKGKTANGQYKVVYGNQKSGFAQINCGTKSYIFISKENLKIPLASVSDCATLETQLGEKLKTHDIYVQTNLNKTITTPELNSKAKRELSQKRFLENLVYLNKTTLNYEENPSALNGFVLEGALATYDSGAIEAGLGADTSVTHTIGIDRATANETLKAK